MKKLLTICLLIAIAFTGQAQDGKPTKEQTVEFIENYMVDKTSGYVTREKSEGVETRKYSHENFKIFFDDTKNRMAISYESNYEYSYVHPKLPDDKLKTKEYIKVVLDFSKIESVFVSALDLRQVKNSSPANSDFIIYLVFNTPDKAIKYYSYSNDDNIKEFPSDPELKKQMIIPMQSYSCDGCNHQEDNKKIIQAFNHLRKLCGAPEPISFD